MLEDLPGVLCVGMKGAAVAKVCYEHGIPFSILRTISDSANHDAVEEFQAFIQQIAGHFSANMIQCILRTNEVSE